ncbi:hypothetical protein [Streptomyces europaeiscabiei]|uniref:hypothetical protein n=1 Tax=Streptomyces europaeiscabiei TaxID=146819 RepID=UPI0038F7ABAE
MTYPCGANPGVDPEHILRVADGVVPCAGGPGLLPAFAGAGAEGAVPAADFGTAPGTGGSPVTLARGAGRGARGAGRGARGAGRGAELGTTELGLYHGRLASGQDDLTAVRQALTAVG